jgi:hypothetical protein
MNTDWQMNILRNGLIVAALSAVVGCAYNAYRVSSGDPISRLSFDLATDSTGTTGKWFRVYSYRDLSCAPSERGWIVAMTSALGSATTGDTLGPVDIRAGEPFTFVVSYAESRFAQNRECSFTASFTPEAGRAYRASFAVTKQSNVCNLQIEDDRNTRVSYATPEDSCYQGLVGRMPNGGGGTLRYNIQIR